MHASTSQGANDMVTDIKPYSSAITHELPQKQTQNYIHSSELILMLTKNSGSYVSILKF